MASTTNKGSASLGGKPLVIESGSVRWSLREGVHPSIQEFEMAPDDAKEIWGKSGPLTLEFQHPDGKKVTIEQLWCLNLQPGPNPWISVVTIADRRWFWSYSLVRRVFNKRRNIGVKRVLANDEFAVDFDRAFEVGWWGWSLDNNRRYVPLRILQKVLEDVAEAEASGGGSKFPVTIESHIGTRIKGLPIEDLEIIDQGDMAVQRALETLPEAGITVDYNGTVVVFSKASGNESAIVKALLPEIRDMGHTDLVKNKNIRPKKIHVYFVRECEVRFDFIEEARTRGMTTTDEPLGDLRRMQNVLPLPDYDLKVNGRTLPQGSWVSFDDVFPAWGTMPLMGVTRALDHDLMQMAMIPHMELYEAMMVSGSRPDEQKILWNWTDRIATAFAHYRTTFQLNRKWVDRFYSWRNYRLLTINPQNGTRGPSRAYGDYCILYTQRSLWRSRKKGEPLDYAINRSAYPSSGNLDDTAAPSPATVDVADHDLGIIHLDYRGKDPLSGDTRTILPSKMAEDGMPTADNSRKLQPISFDTVINTNTPPRLSPSFKMALVITAIPAAPNDKRCLHKITVNPSDVRDLLPPGMQTGLNDCEGPEMEIFVGPNKEVARVIWNDGKADEIEKVFGLREGEPNLTGLVLNEGDAIELEKGASLNQIARAEAALIYASLVDRYEGEATGDMNGGVRLSGWTQSIDHELTPDGEMLTKVSFPAQIPKFSLFSFLDSNTRAAIIKLAQPEA